MPLPGERQHRVCARGELPRALAIVVGLCALGCAGSATSRRMPPALFQADRFEAKAGHREPRAGSDESAALLERRLHVLGYRFGTDGTVPALWGYLRAAHRL